jgi:hypothetical protein
MTQSLVALLLFITKHSPGETEEHHEEHQSRDSKRTASGLMSEALLPHLTILVDYLVNNLTTLTVSRL